MSDKDTTVPGPGEKDTVIAALFAATSRNPAAPSVTISDLEQRFSRLLAAGRDAHDAVLTRKEFLLLHAKDLLRMASDPRRGDGIHVARGRFSDLEREWEMLPRLAPDYEAALAEQLTNIWSALERLSADLDAKQLRSARRREGLVAYAEQLALWGKDMSEEALLGSALEIAVRWAETGDPGAKLDAKLELRARFQRALTCLEPFVDERHGDPIDVLVYNLALKYGLLERARALLSAASSERAREELRRVRAAWEEVGRIPDRFKFEVEDALRQVEWAVADAEADEQKKRQRRVAWPRSPRRRPRAFDTGTRAEVDTRLLQAAIRRFEELLEQAKAEDDVGAMSYAEAAIEARRELISQTLTTVEKPEESAEHSDKPLF